MIVTLKRPAVGDEITVTQDGRLFLAPGTDRPQVFRVTRIDENDNIHLEPVRALEPVKP